MAYVVRLAGRSKWQSLKSQSVVRPPAMPFENGGGNHHFTEECGGNPSVSAPIEERLHEKKRTPEGAPSYGSPRKTERYEGRQRS